jgi:mono/diheme cytochrome c family protein
MVAMPQSIVPGSVMPRSLMPPTQLDLITRYLRSLPGNAPESATAPTRSPPAASPPDGAALYAKWCAACHGTGGAGDGPNAANLPVTPAAHASRDAMAARPDDSLFDTIAGGGAIMNRSPRMPAFGATLSAAEIRALVRHIRSLCRCEGPSWSRQ